MTINIRWVFPWLHLAISAPRCEREKEDENVVATDGWVPPKPSSHPTSGCSSNDRNPPPLVDTTLAA